MSEHKQDGRPRDGAQGQQVKSEQQEREQAPRTEASLSPEPEPQKDSFQPILSEQYLRRSSALSLRPRIRARVALVLVGVNGRPRLFDPDKRPTVGELFWGGAGTLYEVDMSLNRTSIELDLPSHGDTAAFHVSASVEWRVLKPLLTVENGISDVRETLMPPLRERLSRITRGYHARAVANAEEEAVKKNREEEDIGAPYGLRTKIYLHFTMHEAAAAQLTKLEYVAHEIAVEEETHKLNLLQARNTQQLLDLKVTRYRSLMEAGDINRFALQLAQNPDDVASVVQAIQAEKERDRRYATEFVSQLLESGVIEKWEMSDQARAALEILKTSTQNLIKPPEVPSGTNSEEPRAIQSEVIDSNSSTDARAQDPASPPSSTS
jgi:hypothetical protein